MPSLLTAHVYGVNSYPGKRLTMALAFTITFFRFHFKYMDFFTSACLIDSASHRSAHNEWSAYGEGLPFTHSHHFIESDRSAVFHVKFFDIDDIALGDLILFASGFQYSVHVFSLSSINRVTLGTAANIKDALIMPVHNAAEPAVGTTLDSRITACKRLF